MNKHSKGNIHLKTFRGVNIFQYIEKILSPFLCGYRKGFSTQTALLEKWKASLDKKG